MCERSLFGYVDAIVHMILLCICLSISNYCISPHHSLHKISNNSTMQVDIIEVISDALYSDSEAVIDAAAELLDTLLKRNAEDTATMESLSLVSTFMQNASASATNLLQTEEAMKAKEAERDAILVELVSAVGLQRFRFDTGMFIFPTSLFNDMINATCIVILF